MEHAARVGCCFTISYGAWMKPCCMVTSHLPMEECFRSEMRDAGALLVDAQGSTPGSVKSGLAAHALGADRGWRKLCPANASEASAFLVDQEDTKQIFKQEAELGGEFRFKKGTGQERLPWWAWVVTSCALGLAVVANLMQVSVEWHRRRERLRTLRDGDGIDQAVRAITRTFGTAELEEALRDVVHTPQSVPNSSLRVPSGSSPYVQVPPVFPVFKANTASTVSNPVTSQAATVSIQSIHIPMMTQVSRHSLGSSPQVTTSPSAEVARCPAGGFSPMVQVGTTLYTTQV